MSHRVPIETYITARSEADMKRVDQFGKQISTNLVQTRQKLQMLWTYGMQVTNILLRVASKAAKGTAAQAGVQATIAGVQLVQAETAVLLTGKQAAAAFATGTPWGITQGILLTAIATSMQSSIIIAQMNKIIAEDAARRAEEVRQMMESYNI